MGMNTTNQTDLELATQVIVAMYDDWENNGGVSPSTRDESYAVACALSRAYDPDTDTENVDYYLVDDDTLDRIYDVAQDGAEIEQIAALHVEALRVAGA